MAFDGFCIRRIVKEYNEMLSGGRIVKIIEPNDFDIILVIRREKDSHNLFASANPSMSYTYLTNDKGEASDRPYNFCMVLRKYIANGKVMKISQKGNERIIVFEIEHLNEMGDRSIKKLVFELMGKHSNIILTDENDVIIDSIKRINALKSSVREVLPGKPYFVPENISKIDPFSFKSEKELLEFFKDNKENESLCNKPVNYLVNTFEGVSKIAAKEIVFRMDDPESVNKNFSDLNENEQQLLASSFVSFMKEDENSGKVYVYSKENKCFEYTNVLFKSLSECKVEEKDILCEFLSKFYKEKHDESIVRQKSGDMINLLSGILQKDKNKREEWLKEIDECQNMDTYKKYGELLKAYSHSLQRGSSVNVLDYYTGEYIDIELDENKTIIENSNKFFNEYSKEKRRAVKLKELIKENDKEIEYLEEMLLFISISDNSTDLMQIREELVEKGYLKKNDKYKVKKKTSGVRHYIYKNNYHIYVGKNSVQNEEVSFNIATGNDWWFHAKGIPGAHVIVKSDSDNDAAEWDMPAEVFDLCGAIAAINSSHSGFSKVEIDYTRKKHLKKPAEREKGMVIYHTYYSMVAIPDISRFELTSVGP